MDPHRNNLNSSSDPEKMELGTYSSKGPALTNGAS